MGGLGSRNDPRICRPICWRNDGGPLQQNPQINHRPDNRVDGIFELVLQFCMIGHARFCLKGCVGRGDLVFRPASDDCHRPAQITLGVAWRVVQGQEHILRPPPLLLHAVRNYGILAAEPVLVPNRSKLRFAVWGCYLAKRAAPSRLASITPMRGSILGRRCGLWRQ